MNTDPGDRHR